MLHRAAVHVAGMQAAGGAGGQSQVISVQPGQMFEPVVERIAGNVAVDMAGQAVNQMNEQLLDRVNEILDDPRMR